MPKVGDKEFPYTPEGMKNAKQESSATGVPIQDANERTQNYQLGGKVPGQQGFGANPNQPQAPGTVGSPVQPGPEISPVGPIEDDPIPYQEGGEVEKYQFGGKIGDLMQKLKGRKGESGWLGANPFKKGISSGRKSSGSWLDRIKKLGTTEAYAGRHADTVNAPAEVPEVAPPVEAPIAPEVAPEVPMEAPVAPEVPGIVPEEEVPVEAAESDYVSGREEFAKGGKVNPISQHVTDDMTTFEKNEARRKAHKKSVKESAGRGNKKRKARKAMRAKIRGVRKEARADIKGIRSKAKKGKYDAIDKADKKGKVRKQLVKSFGIENDRYDISDMSKSISRKHFGKYEPKKKVVAKKVAPKKVVAKKVVPKKVAPKKEDKPENKPKTTISIVDKAGNLYKEDDKTITKPIIRPVKKEKKKAEKKKSYYGTDINYNTMYFDLESQTWKNKP